MLDALPERQRESLLAAASFISDVRPQVLDCLPALFVLVNALGPEQPGCQHAGNCCLHFLHH